jgi:hypothetical protein
MKKSGQKQSSSILDHIKSDYLAEIEAARKKGTLAERKILYGHRDLYSSFQSYRSYRRDISQAVARVIAKGF